MKLRAETGSLEPRRQGHGVGGGKLADHAVFVRERLGRNGDLTLDELCVELEGRGVIVHRSSVGRLLDRLGVSHKKDASGQRPATAGHPAGARALDQAAQAILRQGPNAAHLYRRDVDQHAADQAHRLVAKRPALSHTGAVR